MSSVGPWHQSLLNWMEIWVWPPPLGRRVSLLKVPIQSATTFGNLKASFLHWIESVTPFLFDHPLKIIDLFLFSLSVYLIKKQHFFRDPLRQLTIFYLCWTKICIWALLYSKLHIISISSNPKLSLRFHWCQQLLFLIYFPGRTKFIKVELKMLSKSW